MRGTQSKDLRTPDDKFRKTPELRRSNDSIHSRNSSVTKTAEEKRLSKFYKK